jgi:HEAT repeat protein
MKKLATFACLLIAMGLMVGCGTQNEYLSKGKEWVKSDKRGRIAKAVAQFELAIEQEPDNAEAHYLLGYYDETATIQRRAEQMILAYKYDKRKYLKILIEEALRDRDENVRKSAAKALHDIHSQMDSMIKPLVKTLKSKDSRDRDDAALVLSKLDNHKEVADRLMENDILKNRRMNTRFDAVRALGNIGDPRAIDLLMERITALKTEDEKGEEPEVRRAAVVALRQIAKRNIEITGQSLDIQVEPAEEGVRVVGGVTDQTTLQRGVTDQTTLQKGEIISHIVDNKKITSLQGYNELLAQALEDSEEVTFGLPKIVKIRVSNSQELGIKKDDMKSDPTGRGIVVGKLEIDSKAGKMGIEKGELISHINDQQVRSVEDYDRIVAEAISKGEELTFEVANDDKYRLLSIPVPEDSRDLGMEVKELPMGAEGVVVTEVRPRSPAVEAGIRKGQIISYIVSKKKIHSVDEYKQLLKDGLEDGKVTISVINKEAIGRLIDVLRNKGLIVRFDAAQALGEIKDKAAVDSLIEMLQEEANPIEIRL